jgi:type III restriction enzyme
MAYTVAMVTHTPGVMGGSARIGDTRVAVWNVVRFRQLGLRDADILKQYPELSAAELHAAFRYYASHRAEIDRDILENERAEYQPAL